jgi:hypothetical protein
MELEAHHRVHKKIPLRPILSQFNTIHSLKPYLPKNHFNIILPPTLTSSTWSLPLRFQNTIFMHLSLTHACYMSHPAHPSWFDNSKSTHSLAFSRFDILRLRYDTY